MRKITLTGLFAILAGLAVVIAQSNATKKLMWAESAIKQLYIDTVNEDKLVEDAIKGMLEKLDPHSSYTNAEETRELNEPLQGNFSGIGISFNMTQDTLYVIQTVSGGPSEKVGILAGDRIIAVNDSSIAGQKMKNSEIMKRLRGPKGTKVNLKILRKPDTIDFVVTRAEIPIYSVDAAYMVDPTTGYIKLNKFAAETPKEMEKALRQLKEEGMENLILDLTDNGGGYLQAAVDLLGEFLDPGSLAVYTEGLNSPRSNNYAHPGALIPLFEDGRLVVMMNQYSASASEITAGAIQDWDRGLVVGRRSFGKGLVQRPIPFLDGSMMRLTIAHYYTPTGRDIQKPYTKGDAKSYENDIADRFNNGELMHEDSLKVNKDLKVLTLKNKREKFGGGGIYPDRFVPLDTAEYTKYYRNVMAKGLINKFVIQYVDANRDNLKSEYINDDNFVRDFKVTDEMLDELIKMAENEKVEFNEGEFERSKPLFENVIKALIGRDVFENQTFYKVQNGHDPIFKEALRLINSDEYPLLLGPGPVIIDKSSIDPQ